MMLGRHQITRVAVAALAFCCVATLSIVHADARVETARSTGIWQVQAGDTLYGIARKIYPDDPGSQAKLRSGLLVLNRDAFANGVPEGLHADAQLKLPGFAIEKIEIAQPKLPEPEKPEVVVEAKQPVVKVSPKPKADFVGKVIFARGQMTAEQTDGAVRKLTRNSAIYEGDKITTPDRGFGHLQLTDGALLAIRPASQLEIEEFTYNGQQDGSESSILRLIKGGFRTITGTVGKTNKRKYRVNTTVATVGIRGTHYGLRLCEPTCELADGETTQTGLFGGVVDGSISVSNNSGETVFGNDEYFRVASLLEPPERMLAPPGVIFDGRETASTSKLSADEKATMSQDSGSILLGTAHAESSLLSDQAVDTVFAAIRIESNLTPDASRSTDPMDPVEVDPVEVDPVEVDPVEVDPVEVDPVEVDPVEIDPVEIDPVEIDPVEIDPVEIDPINRIKLITAYLE